MCASLRLPGLTSVLMHLNLGVEVRPFAIEPRWAYVTIVFYSKSVMILIARARDAVIH